MTLTPQDIRHLLSSLTGGEGRIRPGGYTALEHLALVEKLNAMAQEMESPCDN